jgi:hypothetical protein
MKGSKKYLIGIIVILLTGCNSISNKKKGTVSNVAFSIVQIDKQEKSEDKVVTEEVEDTDNSELSSQDTDKHDDTVKQDNDTSTTTNNNTETQNDTTSESEQNNTQTTPNPTPTPNPTQEVPTTPTPPSYEYVVGNSGELYATYELANAAARKYKTEYVSDVNYVSGFTVIQTYDKFTIQYEYRYFQ